jgi:hypothetical protein
MHSGQRKRKPGKNRFVALQAARAQLQAQAIILRPPFSGDDRLQTPLLQCTKIAGCEQKEGKAAVRLPAALPTPMTLNFLIARPTP